MDLGVKVFCTGRPVLNNIKSLLNSPAEIPAKYQETDVRFYVSVRLNREWRYGDKFKQDILDAVIRKSEKYSPVVLNTNIE